MNAAVRLTLLLTVFALASCATTQRTEPSFTSVEIKLPALNEVRTERLGNTLVSFSEMSFAGSYEITDTIISEPNFAGVYCKVLPHTMKPTGTVNGVPTFAIPPGKFEVHGGLSINGPVNFDWFSSAVLEDGKQVIKIGCGNKVISLPLGERVSPKKYIDLSLPNISREFIYNGRVANKIKFLYREFAEGLYIRAPFSQEVEYDLNIGKEIGFKDMRLEIIECTNRSITYKVLEHFDSSESISKNLNKTL
ncbi:hypothetical protein OAL10_05925 [Gammaproteobacteria bacterium]|nr:hypothetical protein [Gammaproteobacteria bacterium]